MAAKTVNLKSIGGNLSVAVIAQLIVLGMSLLQSFLVPKLLNVEEFGYWQLFVFYASYTGFFTLGINDGVYLVLGGKTRGEIDKRSVESQFLVALTIQVVICAVCLVFAFCYVGEQSRRYVLVATAAYLLLYNMSGFLGYLFQAMNETRLFSYSTMISRGLYLVPLVCMLAFKVGTFIPYVVFYVAVQGIALLYCVLMARDILRTKPYGVKRSIGESFASARVGIVLMLSNIASMLILGVLRFVVDEHWGIEVFGEVSFALQLVSLFIVFATQLAMVLFPALRQFDRFRLADVYTLIRSVLTLGLPFAYLLYFPVEAAVGWWLPQYKTSLYYLSVLLPICLFDCKMNLVGTTFFKVLRQEKRLLLVNVLSVAVSGILVMVATYVFNDLIAAIASTVVVICFRSTLSEVLLGRYFGYFRSGSVVGEIVLSIAYLVLVINLSGLVAAAGFFLFYCAYILVNRKDVLSLVALVRRHGSEAS